MTLTLEIDGWKSKICFSSSHILLGHKKCGYLHGHTYAIHSKVYGKKNEQGFIIDFATLKSYLLEIASELDHRILIPEKNKYVAVEENEIRINFENKKYILPKEDCVLLPIESVSTENLAEYILEKLFNKINQHENIKKIEIGLDEGIGQGIKLEKIVG